jgi:hypothetical protein
VRCENGTDLYRRQLRTWEKIPQPLQKGICKKVIGTIEDRITRVHGIQKESTTGFDDDLDALRRELGDDCPNDTTPASSQMPPDPDLDGS